MPSLFRAARVPRAPLGNRDFEEIGQGARGETDGLLLLRRRHFRRRRRARFFPIRGNRRDAEARCEHESGLGLEVGGRGEVSVTYCGRSESASE